MLALKRLDHLTQARLKPPDPNSDKTPAPSAFPSPSKHHPSPNRQRERDTSVFPWEFTSDELTRFPALRKRNFFLIQRHQARALHYDLRLQLDGGTLSWALPKGLIGMSKTAESSHMAVQTTVHPISYSTHEGSDGSVFSGGRRGGTLLWDIGEYEIGDSASSPDGPSSEEDLRIRKRRRVNEEQDDEDPLGRHEEDKLRDRFERPVSSDKQRTIRLTLKNGRKMNGHSFILVLDVQNSRSLTFGRGGQEKKSWFVRLPKHVDAYPWDQGGEDGDFWGRSVKTGRTFAEVCSSKPKAPAMFESELARYTGWSEAKADSNVDWEDKIKVAVVEQSPKKTPRKK